MLRSHGRWISASHPLLVAGYFTAELGVGEAGRLLVRGLEAAGIPLITETLVGTGNRRAVRFPERRGHPETSRMIVVCDNADGVQRFAATRPPDFLQSRYVVGLWFWEVDVFPPMMHGGFDVVDEVWAASDHVQRVLASAGRRPVHRISLPLTVREPVTLLSREAYGLPSGFLFLFSFDYTSVLARKNPEGVISAFRMAFPRGDEHAALLIKSINGRRFPAQVRRLRGCAAGDPRIVFMDRYLSREDSLRLTATADAYVSLHRAEGLGLTLAEAMSLGRPVIATGYSGNLDFMDDRNSLLVGFTRVPVPPEALPYPPEARWAEPDLAQAARHMQRLARDERLAADVGARARQSLDMSYSDEACAPLLRHRLAAAERRASWQRSAAGRALRRAHSLAVRGRRRLDRRRSRRSIP